jgi:hypothetical protein
MDRHNPFDADYSEPEPYVSDFYEDAGREPRPKATATPPGFREWTGDLIAEPGAYIGVPIDRYHGAEICDGPSISSTGIKKLVGNRGARTKGKTPRHFWQQSQFNPNRRAIDTDALRLGRAFHDALLMPQDWQDLYYRTPAGFSRAGKVKMADEIAAADAAMERGLCVMSAVEAQEIEAMVEAMRADPLTAALLKSGHPEVTLAWKDEATGVWCRARPDFMLANRAFALNIKTDADASFDGFSKSIAKFGYAQSAALEMDGYKAVFGKEPGKFLHPVVEKPAKGQWRPGDFIPTAMWELPAEDIERGRWLNKIALRTFAECLATGVWPSYTTDPEPCGLPGWARKVLDEGGQFEAANDAVEGNPWTEN